MTANFKIIKNHALEYEGRHLDLHNNFLFTSLNFDVNSRKLQLTWKRGVGDWIPQTELNKITLIIFDV